MYEKRTFNDFALKYCKVMIYLALFCCFLFIPVSATCGINCMCIDTPNPAGGDGSSGNPWIFAKGTQYHLYSSCTAPYNYIGAWNANDYGDGLTLNSATSYNAYFTTSNKDTGGTIDCSPYHGLLYYEIGEGPFTMEMDITYPCISSSTKFDLAFSGTGDKRNLWFEITNADGTNSILTSMTSFTDANSATLYNQFLITGEYKIYYQVEYGGVNYGDTTYFTIYQTCTNASSGSNTPQNNLITDHTGPTYRPTPYTTISAWSNYTNNVNLSTPSINLFPTTDINEFNISNTTLFPTIPPTIANVVNISDIKNQIEDAVNDSLIPPEMVNSYENIWDSITDIIKKLVFNVLQFILKPIYWISNLISSVIDYCTDALESLLYYFKAIFIFLRTIMILIPPPIHALITVVLTMDLIYIILKQRF